MSWLLHNLIELLTNSDIYGICASTIATENVQTRRKMYTYPTNKHPNKKSNPSTNPTVVLNVKPLKYVSSSSENQKVKNKPRKFEKNSSSTIGSLRSGVEHISDQEAAEAADKSKTGSGIFT